MRVNKIEHIHFQKKKKKKKKIQKYTDRILKKKKKQKQKKNTPGLFVRDIWHSCNYCD